VWKTSSAEKKCGIEPGKGGRKKVFLTEELKNLTRRGRLTHDYTVPKKEQFPKKETPPEAYRDHLEGGSIK